LVVLSCDATSAYAKDGGGGCGAGTAVVEGADGKEVGTANSACQSNGMAEALVTTVRQKLTVEIGEIKTIPGMFLKSGEFTQPIECRPNCCVEVSREIGSIGVVTKRWNCEEPHTMAIGRCETRHSINVSFKSHRKLVGEKGDGAHAR